MAWRRQPKRIIDCPSEIDYVLFIDENGSGDLSHILSNPDYYAGEQEYLAITGVAVQTCNLKSIEESIMALKMRYWNNGVWDYNGKLKRVCFHSNDIRKKQGPFNPRIIDIQSFQSDLSSTISNLPITIFTSAIDKVAHCNKYISPHHPYNLSLDFIIERFANHFLGRDKKALIIIEARGKNEDKFTLGHLSALMDFGTRYISNEVLNNSIQGIYFNEKWCIKYDEQKSYFGLEIADLCSYPIFKYIRYGTKDPAFECVETKIYRYPNYWGCGIKIFP